MNKPTKARMRYGAFSAVTTAVVLAALIAVNIVATGLNVKFDLTTNKLYEITDETKELLDGLNEDVVIYTLFRTGTETEDQVTLLSEIAQQYAAYSPRVRVENKDPYVYKAFVEQYGGELPLNSVVVVGSRRAKAIDASGLYTLVEDTSTGEQVWQVEIEPKITNAIVYVTMDETDTAYVLTGHREAGVGGFEAYLGEANYDVKTLNLLTAAGVPEDCDVLIMTAPETDISASEAERIAAYLQGGGRLFIDADYTAAPLPRFNSIIEAYGLSFQNVVVHEGNANYALPQNNALILPLPQNHDATKTMRENGAPMLLYMANAVGRTEFKRSSTIITPLLTTSPQAFGKRDASGESLNKEAGDAPGPFDLATAAVDEYGIGMQGYYTKLVAFGGMALFDEELDAMVGGANSAFFINAMNWLIDRPEDYVYVAPKHLTGDAPLAMTATGALWLKLFAMGLLPCAIFAAGAVVWLRRRNK